MDWGSHWGVARRLGRYGVGLGLLTFAVAIAWLIVATPEGKTMPTVLQGLVSSPAMMFDIAFFVVAYFGAHYLLGVLWYWLIVPLVTRFVSPAARSDASLASFLPCLIALLVWNGRMYPNSQFELDFASEAVLATLASALLAYVVLLSIAGLAMWLLRAVALVRNRKGAVAFASVGIVVAASAIAVTTGTDVAVDRPPDIILIGADSLRPDHVGFISGQTPSLTPTLDELLADSAVFEHTWTPIGQTYAAWMSILSGQYPATHRAYYNLIERSSVADAGNLAHRLGELGYHRIYALDEVRFSNMDASYGFDVAITPAIGAFDFLSAQFDMPLVNLASGNAIGRVLFPYNHINRAVAVTYRPEVFDARVRGAIDAAPEDQPLFLLAHFELPHWPYRWAHYDATAVDVPDPRGARTPIEYQISVWRTDQQYRALIAALEEAGRLDNAIVVILSDHGEAFRESEPWWETPIAEDITDRRVFAGATTDFIDVSERRVFARSFHGSNVVSEAQNRVLLAFRGYGPQADVVAAHVHDDVTVSLVDIRPTLEEWLGLGTTAPLEGSSLLSAVSGRTDPGLRERAVGVESGFSLPSIARGNPDAAEILREGAQYYDLDHKGRLYLKDEWLQFFRSQKQRAVVRGDWMMTALPADGEGLDQVFVLADFGTAEYWIEGSFPAHLPHEELLEQLCDLFARDDKFRASACAQR